MEEDFIKQPFLKLYAKHKGNTNGINKTHADESGARDFEEDMFCCVSMRLKTKTHTVKLILEEEFIKQLILNLYAKIKGNTSGIKTPQADDSGARDVEKDICVLRVHVP